MSEQDQLGPSQDGSVLLDIGGHIGALIIVTTAQLHGREIEISATTEGAKRTHVAVRERLGRHGSRYAAIYPPLPAGTYTIWADHDRPAQTVTIKGGSVTQIQWR